MKYVIFRKVDDGQSVDLPMLFSEQIPFADILKLERDSFRVLVSAGIAQLHPGGYRVEPSAEHSISMAPRPVDARILDRWLLPEQKRETKQRLLFNVDGDMIFDVNELAHASSAAMAALHEDQRPSFKFTLGNGKRQNGDHYEQLVIQYTGDDTDEEFQERAARIRQILEPLVKQWKARAASLRKTEASQAAAAETKAKAVPAKA